jgi:hypothetical protein
VFGQATVNFLDHVHRQHFAVRLARELVGAVAGAHGDRQRVDLRLAHEIDRLVRVRQQLRVVQLALGAMAVLGFAHARLKRTEHAQLAFH